MKTNTSNYFKSVTEILAETTSIGNLLPGADKYYAHINPGRSNPETLNEHCNLVQEYLEKLCRAHLLDTVIDGIIREILVGNGIESQAETYGNFIKKLFVDTIVFHDYGKINPNFQADPQKMNNPFFKDKLDPESPLSTNHSMLGAYFYLCLHFSEIEQNKAIGNKKLLIYYITLVLSFSIFKHHSGSLPDDIEKNIRFRKEEILEMENFLQEFHFNIPKVISTTVMQHLPNLWENISTSVSSKEIYCEFALYSLQKLNFSLLTAADYLATNEYMNGTIIQKQDLGTLERRRVLEIYNSVGNTQEYNRATYSQIENYEFINPTKVSNENLNILRQEMAVEIINNVRDHSGSNLFYIEAPTGGGKTNLSMLAAVELLNAYENINKIFYVFPFTTLITQTYGSLISTLELDEQEIVAIHSKSGFKTGEEMKEGEYGKEKKNYIDNLFINYPVTLLSHIRFFDILKSNGKESNYILHRLANSIVIIDELQSYTPAHWDKVIYFFRNYARLFNIKLILMSATLPKLDKLSVISGQVDEFVNLLDDPRKRYFRNPNFRNRVNYDFSLLDRKNINMDDLGRFVMEKSVEYSGKDFGASKPKDSVYTIVEFIFKKSATEFYNVMNRINDGNGFFDEIFVLSGTILEIRRKHIINYLKNPENRKKRILLITTQVVEAGVDIDMDIGFKNKSIIDSDEQLAGRINRNVRKKDCTLYLFEHNEPKIIYQKDKRYFYGEKLGIDQHRQILEQKDFDQLYDLLLDGIDEWNKKRGAIGLDEYLDSIKLLQFNSVHQKFKLIEQDTISIFVPLRLPVTVEGTEAGKTEEMFSNMEIKFLENFGIIPDDGNMISGEEIFGLYASMIQDREKDFIKGRINMKIMQGIMSKFVFSIFRGVNNPVLTYCTNDEYNSYGYYYMDCFEAAYSIESGFDPRENDTIII